MTPVLIKYTRAIIALAAIAVFCSCNKQLNEGPITATYGEKFWTSQRSAEQATLAMYGQLRACLRATPANNLNEPSHFIFGDLVSGLFLPSAGDVFVGYGLKAVNTVASKPWNFSYVPYGENILHDWSRFYQLIAQANLVLREVPKMPASLFASQEVKNRYLGEAYFVRAYAYFYIMRVWGDPVYVSTTYDDVDYGQIPPIARTRETIVIDSSLADLELAAGFLSYASSNAQVTRASKGAVYALAAHLSAWKKDYDKTDLYCKKVITEGGYSLEGISTYSNIWKGLSSRENIFEVSTLYNANDPNFGTGSAWSEATFNAYGHFLKGTLVDNQRNSCWISPANGLFDQELFDTTKDARYKKIASYQLASGGDQAGYMLLKYTNFIYQSPDNRSNPYINNNLVLFRLSDIMLLDAEALASKGNLAAATALIKQTEDRAGITDYQTVTTANDMLDEIIRERGREFIGEGSWFYDLIRTEEKLGWLVKVGYPSGRVTTTAKGYYWPLNMTTLFPLNNLLTQNPYWSANIGK
jgi:hypothetical protein